MDESVKFTWAHMIEHGVLTTCKWSYYGAGFDLILNNKSFSVYEKAYKDFKEAVKTVGVDWQKTSIPESSMESCFEGTFTESSDVEALIGTLVLKNGKEYIVGLSNHGIKFGEYIRLVKKHLDDKDFVKNVLGE